MGQPTHKSLQSTFAPAPPRGNKLQGLLKPAPRAPQPGPGVDDQPPQDPHTDGIASPGSPLHDNETVPARNPSAVPTQPSAAAPASPPVGKRARSETGATSVYLRTKAYRELVDRRQKRFRSYAQTVYDAFAYVRDQARDEQQNPAVALAKLFDFGDAEDPWLMPEPRSARTNPEPTIEARISFKPQERKWVEERMSEMGATHLSPFLATVLENYLLNARKS